MDRDTRTIATGTTVYSQDGAKVGDVSESTNSYLAVQKGWLFVTDRYVPLSAIDRVDANGVYLNMNQDQLDGVDWTTPPVADRTQTVARLDTTSATSSDADETIYARPRTGPLPSPAAAPISQAAASLDQTDDVTIPVIEEDVRVGKRTVEGGGVQVTTRVRAVPVNEQVTLHEEHVDVHRQPVDRTASAADVAAMQNRSFEVRERTEEAIVAKQARVVEEVHVKKNLEQRTETVQDTVRRTGVDVENLPRGTGTSSTQTIGRIGTQGVTGQAADKGAIERGASRDETAAEQGTSSDRDRAVEQREPRKTI